MVKHIRFIRPWEYFQFLGVLLMSLYASQSVFAAGLESVLACCQGKNDVNMMACRYPLTRRFGP